MAAADSSEQQLRFRWNDHTEHLSKVLSQQRQQEQYCDVTLVSDDGYLTKAHQAVLASSSAYFGRVLAGVRADQHPVIVLRGANLRELTCLLDYMYLGNTQVEQSLIESVLEVADLLGVKGLSGIRANPTIQKFMATTTTTTTTTATTTTTTTPEGGDVGEIDLTPLPDPTPKCDPPQTSGIDLSMAKNEPRSPKENIGIGLVTATLPPPTPTTPTPTPLEPPLSREGGVGVVEGEGEEPLLPLPLPQSPQEKRRRVDVPEEDENIESEHDPDWGRIGSKVEGSPRGAADAQPRTITLTAITTTAAAATGAGPMVERCLEVPGEAGLTITLTTRHHHHNTTPRPLLPPSPPPLPSPLPPIPKRARRRLRARRGEEGRRRYQDSGYTPTTTPTTTTPITPNSRVLRRRPPTHPTTITGGDVYPTPTPETLQGGAGLTIPQDIPHHHYCQQQPYQLEQQQQHIEASIPPLGPTLASLPPPPPPLDDCDIEGEVGGDGEQGEEGEGGDVFPAVSPVSLFSLPPARPRPKQRRTSLSLEQKVKVVEAFLEGKSQRQIAGLYGTGKTQVSGIIRRREQVVQQYRDSLVRGGGAKRRRKGGYARLNQHLMQWYRHAMGSGGATVTAGMLRAKALQLAPQLGCHDFKASNGWLAAFKANHNLKFSRPGRATATTTTTLAPPQPQDSEDDLDPPAPPRHPPAPPRHPPPHPSFVEDGEAEGSCNGPDPDDSLDPHRQALDPCVSPAHPGDHQGGLLHPGLVGGLAKPPQMVNPLGANLSAYTLSREVGRGDATQGDLATMTHSPLAHPAKPPEAPLAPYKEEPPLPYAYDPQNRMAEPAPPRPAEYNYTPYGFPSSYYGYHFLGQY